MKDSTAPTAAAIAALGRRGEFKPYRFTGPLTVDVTFKNYMPAEVLAYLPMAWIGQSIFSYAQSYVVGFCISCPESAQTVGTDMREIGPTYYFAPPAVLEGLLTQVSIRIEDLWWGGRKGYAFFMDLARRVGCRILAATAAGTP